MYGDSIMCDYRVKFGFNLKRSEPLLSRLDSVPLFPRRKYAQYGPLTIWERSLR